MKSADFPDSDTWMEDRIERYLDGDLNAAETTQFEELLRKNETWERELAWATNIRDALRSTPEPVCPPEILGAVMRQAQRSLWRSRLERLRSLLFGFGWVSWRPALAVVTLMVAAVVLFNNRPAENTDAVTRAEVEQALAEVKWTLGYVSKTGRMTGSSVNDALAPLRKPPEAKE